MKTNKPIKRRKSSILLKELKMLTRKKTKSAVTSHKKILQLSQKEKLVCFKCDNMVFTSWDDFQEHHKAHVLEFTNNDLPMVLINNFMPKTLIEPARLSISESTIEKSPQCIPSRVTSPTINQRESVPGVLQHGNGTSKPISPTALPCFQDPKMVKNILDIETTQMEDTTNKSYLDNSVVSFCCLGSCEASSIESMMEDERSQSPSWNSIKDIGESMAPIQTPSIPLQKRSSARFQFIWYDHSGSKTVPCKDFHRQSPTINLPTQNSVPLREIPVPESGTNSSLGNGCSEASIHQACKTNKQPLSETNEVLVLKNRRTPSKVSRSYDGNPSLAKKDDDLEVIQHLKSKEPLSANIVQPAPKCKASIVTLMRNPNITVTSVKKGTSLTSDDDIIEIPVPCEKTSTNGRSSSPSTAPDTAVVSTLDEDFQCSDQRDSVIQESSDGYLSLGSSTGSLSVVSADPKDAAALQLPSYSDKLVGQAQPSLPWEDLLTCQVCNERFSSGNLLSSHLLQHVVMEVSTTKSRRRAGADGVGRTSTKRRAKTFSVENVSHRSKQLELSVDQSSSTVRFQDAQRGSVEKTLYQEGKDAMTKKNRYDYKKDIKYIIIRKELIRRGMIPNKKATKSSILSSSENSCSPASLTVSNDRTTRSLKEVATHDGQQTKPRSSESVKKKIIKATKSSCSVTAFKKDWNISSLTKSMRQSSRKSGDISSMNMLPDNHQNLCSPIYSIFEDIAIIEFIQENNRYEDAKNGKCKDLWNEIASLETLKGRNGESIKGRFFKGIKRNFLDHLNYYNLDPATLQKIRDIYTAKIALEIRTPMKNNLSKSVKGKVQLPVSAGTAQ